MSSPTGLDRRRTAGIRYSIFAVVLGRHCYPRRVINHCQTAGGFYAVTAVAAAAAGLGIIARCFKDAN